MFACAVVPKRQMCVVCVLCEALVLYVSRIMVDITILEYILHLSV